eukprot:TRINITY_DN16465_c0_g1_i4.p2 TRINITY_DN16465_c0_g1~~TRINITY_DN16465_c0_g1_i4.p2  ORF type:complete len:136 (+),score=23.78 TRINITY_DN16465_c0_g1_i4:49-456(+)
MWPYILLFSFCNFYSIFLLFIRIFFFFLMIRRPPRSTHCISSAASDVYKRQGINAEYMGILIKTNSQLQAQSCLGFLSLFLTFLKPVPISLNRYSDDIVIKSILLQILLFKKQSFFVQAQFQKGLKRFKRCLYAP